EDGQAVIHARETEARAFALGHAGFEHALDRIARDPPSVVPYREPQAATPHARTYDQAQRPVDLAVLDRVLDERLHEEGRQPHGQRFRGGVDRYDQLLAEARLLKIEVALHVSQLLLERDELGGTRKLRPD